VGIVLGIRFLGHGTPFRRYIEQRVLKWLIDRRREAFILLSFGAICGAIIWNTAHRTIKLVDVGDVVADLGLYRGIILPAMRLAGADAPFFSLPFKQHRDA
jgi:hypothetical protein